LEGPLCFPEGPDTQVPLPCLEFETAQLELDEGLGGGHDIVGIGARKGVPVDPDGDGIRRLVGTQRGEVRVPFRRLANNGDAARALFAASHQGYAVPKPALGDTTEWLVHPAQWDNHQGTPGFSSPKLAHIQFAAALAEARLPDRRPLLAAAESLLGFQEADGSWGVDTGGMPGAPATYGITLATYLARRTLEMADSTRFAPAIARANRWFQSATPENILDAAAMLLAMPRSEEIRSRCLEMVLNAQTSDGGWGPQVHMPAEDFDTAVVLLALSSVGESGRSSKALARGRAFLVSRQLPSGGWIETTRPSGQQSYAEHISTSGWALYALLMTDPKRQ
jgi:hypothetical protein